MDSSTGTWGSLSAAQPVYQQEQYRESDGTVPQTDRGQVTTRDFAREAQAPEPANRLLDQFAQSNAPGPTDSPQAAAPSKKRKGANGASQRPAKKRNSARSKAASDGSNATAGPNGEGAELPQNEGTSNGVTDAAAAKRAANLQKRKQKAGQRKGALSAETVREDDDGEALPEGQASSAITQTTQASEVNGETAAPANRKRGKAAQKDNANQDGSSQPRKPRKKKTANPSASQEQHEEHAEAIGEETEANAGEGRAAEEQGESAAQNPKPAGKPRKPRRKNTMREQRQDGEGEQEEGENNEDEAGRDSDSDLGEINPDKVTMWELASGKQYGKRSRTETELRKINWPEEKAKRDLAARKVAAGYTDDMEQTFEHFLEEQEDRRKNRWKYREEERAREEAERNRLANGQGNEQHDEGNEENTEKDNKGKKKAKGKGKQKKKKKDGEEAEGENDGAAGEDADGNTDNEEHEEEDETGPSDAQPVNRKRGAGEVQLRIVNGEIVADDNDLVIDRAQQAEDFIETTDMTQEPDNDYTNFANQHSYLNQNKRDPKERVKYKSDPWSEEETDRFFDALSMFGSDFFMIAEMFPPKTRRQIKLKFVREERIDKSRVDRAMMGEKTKKIDLDFYARETDQDRRNFDAYEGLDDFQAKMKVEMADLEAEYRRQVEEDQEVERQRALLEESKEQKKERKKAEAAKKRQLKKLNKGKVVGSGTMGGAPADEQEEEEGAAEAGGDHGAAAAGDGMEAADNETAADVEEPAPEEQEDVADYTADGAIAEEEEEADPMEGLVTPEPDEQAAGDQTNVEEAAEGGEGGEEEYDEEEYDEEEPAEEDYDEGGYDDDIDAAYYGKRRDDDVGGYGDDAYGDF
ncbi:hypothetical protein MBLNU230_g2682t1 [Neophaeotheca triangularis]